MARRKLADPVTRYADQVLNNKLVTGELVRHACERHMRDLETGKERGLRFDLESANRIIEFFPVVARHIEGEWAGQPVKLEPWQQFRLGSVFGWKRDDGSRRFRSTYNCLARKQGKSLEAAGIGLYMLTADGEGGAQCRSYAVKKEQARIVFNVAWHMVGRSHSLSRRLERSRLNIAYLENAGNFAPLSSDTKSQDGLNPSCAICDEIHAHRTREMYDVIESAMGARRQPLHWIITTRGSDQAGICGELDTYTQKVICGEIEDDSWFGFIACLDPDDEWDDPWAWQKANPNLGVSVKMDRLEELALKARHAPSAQSEFKRKHCNIWTEAIVGWLDKPAWVACNDTYDEDDLRGQPCYAGLDLSGSRDLTSLVLLFPDIDGTDKILPYFWLPAAGLDQRAIAESAPYPHWADQGYLRTTPGAAIDKSFVARDIAEICSRFDVQAIAFDRWRIEDLIASLDAIGFETERVQATEEGMATLRYSSAVPMIDWGQGFRDMSPSVDEFETSILNHKMRHPQHPIMTWCASNVVIAADSAGNRKFDKKNSLARIDGAVAAAMAFGVRSRLAAIEKPGPSPYESRGFLQL